MGDTNLEEHILRLSAEKAQYIECCLCFPNPYRDEDVEDITEKFTTAVKRTITHLPILAGRIRSATHHAARPGMLEGVVQLDNISSVQPTVRYLGHQDFPYDLIALEGDGIPPSAFSNELLTPVTDTAHEIETPVFAAQVNFVPGGVVIALCLHRSAGDMTSLSIVINLLSSGLSNDKITNDDLRLQVLEQSRLRDRLSGSRGVKSDLFRNACPNNEQGIPGSTSDNSSANSGHVTSRILTFHLKLLSEVKDLINQRFEYIHGQRANLTSFDALSAILWKGISRALLLRNDPAQEMVDMGVNSKLIIPFNVRKIIEPGLDDSFFGKATIPIVVTSPTIKVSTPFELGTLAHAARSIRIATHDVSEQLVRPMIASVNQHPDAKWSVGVSPTTDVEITSWADLGLEKAHLGLGIGLPKCVRKVGGNVTANGCTIYPPRDGECEVSVQLREDVLEALTNDESFMEFVAQVV